VGGKKFIRRGEQVRGRPSDKGWGLIERKKCGANESHLVTNDHVGMCFLSLVSGKGDKNTHEGLQDKGTIRGGRRESLAKKGGVVKKVWSPFPRSRLRRGNQFRPGRKDAIFEKVTHRIQRGALGKKAIGAPWVGGLSWPAVTKGKNCIGGATRLRGRRHRLSEGRQEKRRRQDSTTLWNEGGT